MLKTRMTDLFGIQHPIQCGTMQWLTRAELVAAVANAGGLACLPAATFDSVDLLVQEIRKTRDMTDKPFGVNISLFPTFRKVPRKEQIDAVIQSGVKIIETSGRAPDPFREQIRAGGLIHLHKCARVRDAVHSQKVGCDCVAVVGAECGGHPSMEEVSTLVLLPQVVSACRIPVLAGGGFADGQSLIAALALGAEGIVMGTRFMATRECPIHERIKKRIVEGEAHETVLVMRSLNNVSRMLKNGMTQKILEMEARKATLEEMSTFLRGERGRAAWENGDVDSALLAIGQGMGRIKDVPTVGELIRRIMVEAVETKRRVDKITA